MAGPKVEIYPSAVAADAPAQWRWRLVAGNGEIVASGEAYVSRAHAIRGVMTMLEIATEFPDITTVAS